MAGYTCFSKAAQGCGSYHRLLSKADACCKIHATKYDEKRTPVSVNGSGGIGEFPPSDTARARRDAWLATRKDARQKYDPAGGEDKGKSNPGGFSATDAMPAGAGDSNASGSGDAEGDAMAAAAASAAASALAMIDPPAPAPADGKDKGDDKGKGDGSPHPLQPLADQLSPLMAEGISETVAPLIEKLAKGAASAPLPHVVEEARKGLESMKADAAMVGIKTAEKLTEVDAALAKIDETKHVEITVSAPNVDKTKIEGAQHENFEMLLRLVGAGENVFMSGPAGSGKTTAAQNVAKALGMDLIVQPVAMDKFEATGFIDAGGTFRESAVYKWAKATKPSILLIDEIDGWLPQALVAMNPILDNKMGIFPGGQQFEINAEHRVIATANTWGTGADAEYVGRNRLDAASLDRFGARLEWGYDEKFERKLLASMMGDFGKRAVKVSQAIRKNLKQHGIKIVWGPRQSIGLAKRIAVGMTMTEALTVSALAALTKTNRERVLSGVDLSEPKPKTAKVAG